MEQIAEQPITNNVSILSSDPDKIEKYKDLLQKVIPFTKSLIKQEKRAAYDFNILLKSAINEYNCAVFVYLNDALEHLINYFLKDLDNLLAGKVDWENTYNSGYELLNDLACVITQTLFHKKNMPQFREFCLQI